MHFQTRLLFFHAILFLLLCAKKKINVQVMCLILHCDDTYMIQS